MKFTFKIKLLMLVEFLLMFVAWAIVPFALLTAKKYNEVNRVYQKNITYKNMRRLPRWARWFETPDDIVTNFGWYELKTKYKDGRTGLWAVPRITIRMRSQD